MLPLRLGLRMASGLAHDDAEKILAARAVRPFASIEDVWRRAAVPVAALERLANADAFAAFGLSRRQALWQVRGLSGAALPLFAAADLREAAREPAVALKPMSAGREVVEDYRHLQLSLRAHPLAFLRPELDRMGIVRCADLAGLKDGRKVAVAGLVLVRQRPGKGNVTFITLEDETGIANAILWQRIFEANRATVMTAAMVCVRGILQKEGAVIHVVTDRIEDQTDLLHSVGRRDFPHRTGPGDGASHGGTPDPRWSGEPGPALRVRSRDFH